MKKYLSTLLLLVPYLTITSCVSENGNESVSLELHSPATNRQIRAWGDNPMRVDVSVNARFPETFFINAIAPTIPVTINGVNRNEQNFIVIKWSEILNGHEVEISEQRQSFIAEGNTSITATHEHSEFDYDQDDTSNFDERSGDTCVWSAIEACLNPGQLDIPTDNVLLNGDFSNGKQYWWATRLEEGTANGEFCLNSPASAEFHWEFNMGYRQPLFIQANTRYTIVFDVKGDRDSEIRLSLDIPERGFLALVDREIPVTTDYVPQSVQYESGGESHENVKFGFDLGNGRDVRYCFDNIKLIREET